jgi:hypothetical protein
MQSMKIEPETNKMLTLSTAHITQKTFDMLVSGKGPITGYPKAYDDENAHGVFVPVMPFANDDDALAEYPDIKLCMRLADKLKCVLIDFDRDCDPAACLPYMYDGA